MSRSAPILLAAILALPLHAQDPVARADTLLLAGRVFAAESLYYTAVRHDPRSPAARLALGRYLASRGALRVGAVLMEEARYFGGDTKLVAEQLTPVYARLGEYRALASLPGSRLLAAERSRAEWLSARPPSISGPDSTTVPYRVSDSQLLGRITLRIGNDSVLATIDGRTEGLVLDTSWAHRKAVRVFTSRTIREPRALAAVALAVSIGELTLTNVPTTLAPKHAGASEAAIGLDLLGRLAPTFDPRTAQLTLRKSGRAPDGIPGVHLPTITNGASVSLVKRDTTFPIGHPDIQRYLRQSRWTLNPRRGEVVVGGQ